MEKHKDDCECIDCKKIKFEDARHFNQIGWLITSFFLVFLGQFFVKFDSSFTPFIILLIIFFGFIVARLFLRSQWKKMKIYEEEKKFWSNWSIRFYIIFILLTEITLFILLLDLISKPLIFLVLITLIMILFLLVLVWDIKKLEKDEIEKKANKL